MTKDIKSQLVAMTKQAVDNERYGLAIELIESIIAIERFNEELQ